MGERNFKELIAAQWAKKKFLCIGLDTDFEKLPEHVREGGVRASMTAFNRAIVDATKDIVCAYKPNTPFYEARGQEGLSSLQETVEYIREVAPDMPIILDAKRGDIGHSNDGSVSYVFGHLRADAVTIHSYLGREAAEPFLEYPGKGVFVLCRTSNKGSGEFQALETSDGPLYKVVARQVARGWNSRGNCGLVVAATYPDEMRAIREVAGDMPFLVPGIGTQGGDLEASVKAAQNSTGGGFIITAARSILYASRGEQFATAARERALTLDGLIRGAL